MNSSLQRGNTRKIKTNRVLLSLLNHGFFAFPHRVAGVGINVTRAGVLKDSESVLESKEA